MNRLLSAVLFLLIGTPALACETVRIGDLEIEHAWSRATIGAERPGVVYLTIRNTGSTDDTLTGLVTPIAGMPMLHQTVITDGVASMPHAMSVPVPRGRRLRWNPAGFMPC